jgi:hypothetical protein
MIAISLSEITMAASVSLTYPPVPFLTTTTTTTRKALPRAYSLFKLMMGWLIA